MLTCETPGLNCELWVMFTREHQMLKRRKKHRLSLIGYNRSKKSAIHLENVIFIDIVKDLSEGLYTSVKILEVVVRQIPIFEI